MKVIIKREQIIRKTEKAAFIRFIAEEPQYETLCLCLPLFYLNETDETSKTLTIGIPGNALILPTSSLSGKYLQHALTPYIYKTLLQDEEHAFIEKKQVKFKDDRANITFPLDKTKYQYFVLSTDINNLKEVSIENDQGVSNSIFEFDVTSPYQLDITLNNDDTPKENWKKK